MKFITLAALAIVSTEACSVTADCGADECCATGEDGTNACVSTIVEEGAEAPVCLEEGTEEGAAALYASAAAIAAAMMY